MDPKDLEKSNDKPSESSNEEPSHIALEMDGSLETHLRAFEMTQPPHILKDAMLTPEIQPTVNHSLRLLNSTVPLPSNPYPEDFNQSPYVEVGYTPQRFRPEDYEKSLSGDDELLASTVSSPTTWLPPEHPDELLEGEEDNPVSPTAYSRSANDYTGAVLNPGQLSSITTYGFPGGAFNSPKRTKTAVDASTTSSPLHVSCQRQSNATTLGEDSLELGNLCNSPETSSSGTQTNSGVPLMQSDQALSTFAIRAKQAGISDWDEKVTKGLRGNNSIFDGRWVLNPSEAWNVPARRTSTLTNSSHGESRDHTISHSTATEPAASSNMEANKMDMRSGEGSPRRSAYDSDQTRTKTLDLEKKQAQSDETQSQKTDDMDILKSPKKAEALRKSQQLENISNEPEAEESLRLQQYVADLSLANKGLQSKLESYDPASILRVFYLRVFETPDPHTPCGEDAEKLVKYKGKVVTNRELYLSLFRDIQDLVAYMTAPVGQNAFQRLTRQPDTVVDENLRSIPLFQSDKIQDRIRLDSDSSRTNKSRHQLGSRSRQQPLNPRAQKQPCSAKDDQLTEHLTEHLGNLATGTETEPTNSAPTSVGSSSNSNVTTDDIFLTANAQSRLQPHFGDPATADFNPAFERTTFPPKQNIVPSTQDIHALAKSHAPIPFPDLSVHGNESLPCGEAGNQLNVYQPVLAGSINFNIGTAQHSKPLHASAVAASNALYEHVGVPNMGPFYPPFQEQQISGLHEQQLGIQVHPSDRQAHQFYGSSQGPPSLLGPSLNMPIRVPHFQGVPQSDAHNQAFALAHAQAQAQIATQNQYRAEPLGRFLGPPGEVYPLDTRNFPLNTAGQHIKGQALGNNPIHHQFPFATHTIGDQGRGTQPLDYTAPIQMIAGQNQQGLRQPLYAFPNYQQRPSSGFPSGEMLMGTVSGQPFIQHPSFGFQAPLLYGSAPGSIAQSYVQPYIPADKFARAPAPNRIASRIAQTNAFQINQPKLPLINSATQTRYPTPIQMARANIATLPYRAGSDNMYPAFIPGVASVRFQDLTRDEPPKFAVAGDEHYIPFVETTSLSKPADWGVLRVSNMPYDITRELILSFLGTHAKIITPDLGPCIHIMMDRSTGKTQDCYIEFFSVPDARAWHTVITRRGPSLNKIGDRILEVELSSQEELMKDLFPRARCVVWNGGSGNNGVQVKETEEAFDSGFKGFITQEELKGLIHHAEQPHRSLYTQKCPSRPYTNLISVLAKFPWHATMLYTLSTRNTLFNATLTLIKSLTSFLRRSSSTSASISLSTSNQNQDRRLPHQSNTPYDSNSNANASNLFRPDLTPPSLTRLEMREKGLNESLLKELVLAGMNAYGFSDRQRWEIYLAATRVLGTGWMRLSPFMSRWPWECVGRKGGFEEDVVEFYAHLLSSPQQPLSLPPPQDALSPQHTSNSHSQALVRQQQQQQQQNQKGALPLVPFGLFNISLYDNTLEGYKSGSVTMAELGGWEMSVILRVIRGECVG